MIRITVLFMALWTMAFYNPIPTQAQSEGLKIGAATKMITPELGSWVQGAGVPRKATEVRDDLEANGLYFSIGIGEL